MHRHARTHTHTRQHWYNQSDTGAANPFLVNPPSPHCWSPKTWDSQKWKKFKIMHNKKTRVAFLKIWLSMRLIHIKTEARHSNDFFGGGVNYATCFWFLPSVMLWISFIFILSYNCGGLLFWRVPSSRHNEAQGHTSDTNDDHIPLSPFLVYCI